MTPFFPEPLLYPQPCDCLWSPDYELIRTWDEPQHRKQQASTEPERYGQRVALAWDQMATEIGPRQPGRCYWNGYWHRTYTVESITITCPEGDLAHPRWSITVRWHNGDRSTHRTPWNAELGDGQPPPPAPPGPAPTPPELRTPHSRCGAGCARCTSRFALIRTAHRRGLL